MAKYGHRPLNWFEAIVNKLGGEHEAERFLRGELAVSEIRHHAPRVWRGVHGVVYLSVSSDGTTGPQWIERLKKAGHRVSDRAKQALNSKDFVPTSGVIYEIAILTSVIFGDLDCVTTKICVEAGKRGLARPNVEIACLIRANFTQKDITAMGIYSIVVMHEPTKGCGDCPHLLEVLHEPDHLDLHAVPSDPVCGWGGGRGFAFIRPQVST